MYCFFYQLLRDYSMRWIIEGLWIVLIFRCILLPLLLTHTILDCLLLKSRQEAHFPLKAANIFCFCIIDGSDYAEKTQGWNKHVLFCCIVHFICAESVTQWIWKYKAIFSVELCLHLLLHALWFPVIFYESAIQHELLKHSENIPFLTHCYCIVFMWNGS